jgi:peptidoglycan glycosyltransferase
MKPYLVKEVLNSKGTVLSTIVPETIGDVIPPETAKIMQEFMRGVVKEGTGVNASITGIDVCGKTGTADHTEDGKPATPHSWFIGFAPYNDPQIAVAVIVEDGGQGGIVAARIASDVMAEALNNK